MEKELSEEQKKELVEYQNLQQQQQLLGLQLQQTSMQVAELDKALEEAEKGGQGFYRVVGSVLVPKTGEELKKELGEEKKDLQARNELFEKQEKKVREKSNELRKKLEKEFGGQQAGEGAVVNG